MQALGWGFQVERFAWAAVELGGNGVEVFTAVGGQVGPEVTPVVWTL
jgi:hypothetical protein